jgi:hypothetical protein
MDGHPLVGVEQQWRAVVEDVEATATEYEERGWETLALHPGDVVPLPPAHDPSLSEQVGFDVVLPGEEFAALQSFVDGVDFTAYEAYRAQEGDVVLLLVVERAPAAERAVLCPLYYAVGQAREMLRAGEEAGVLHAYVRRLETDDRVVFDHADPDPLFPADWTGDGDGDDGESHGTEGTGGGDADDADGVAGGSAGGDAA